MRRHPAGADVRLQATLTAKHCYRGKKCSRNLRWELTKKLLLCMAGAIAPGNTPMIFSEQQAGGTALGWGNFQELGHPGADRIR